MEREGYGHSSTEKSQRPVSRYFIGGLPGDTKSADIKNYFSQFGEVTEVSLMKDKRGKPSGFCFIGIEAVTLTNSIEQLQHCILGANVPQVLIIGRLSGSS